MLPYNTLTILCWLILIAYWVVASVHVKRDRHLGEKAWQSSGFAITMSILFLVIIATLAERSILWELFSIDSIVPDSPIIEALGTVACASGVALAIWARVHLGRNWSSEPALKEGHSLVTSGPYRVIRHPIYAGILVAAFGSALVGGSIWIAVFIIIVLMVFFRIRKEERILTEEFPEQYPQYTKRTSALVPFIL